AQRDCRRGRRRGVPASACHRGHDSDGARAGTRDTRSLDGECLGPKAQSPKPRRIRMAVIRDMMPAFELFQPATIDDALGLLERHGSTAWVMAGGLDTFDWLKDRTKRTAV